VNVDALLSLQERKKRKAHVRSVELANRVALAQRRNRLQHNLFLRSMGRITRGFM
jgi:hypothetical protein